MLCRTERTTRSPCQITIPNIFEKFGFYIFNTVRENSFHKLEIPHFISNYKEKKVLKKQGKIIFVVFRLVKSKNRWLSNIHQCSVVSMEPFSVKSKICGVLNTVAPLHLLTKGITFLLHSKIGESQVCCMKSGVFKKLMLNLSLIVKINGVVCSSKFNYQLGRTSFPTDMCFNR